MFDNNFGKCGPIFNFKILYQLIREKILYILTTKISISPAMLLLTLHLPVLKVIQSQKCYRIFTLNVTINMFN